MIKKYWLYILSTLFFFVFSQNLHAQRDAACVQNLEKAEEEFDHGHLFQVKQLLFKCVQGRSFRNREERIRAHYLMTRTYLYLDQPDSADYHYLEILKLDPEYTVSEETDAIEMVYLAEKFTTSPIISLNARLGSNVSSTTVVNSYPQEYDANNFPKVYQAGWGVQAGIGTQIHFSDYLSLQLAPEFMLRSWRLTQNRFLGIETNIADSMRIRETNALLNLPITLRYTFPGEKYRPYVYGGYAVNLLFFSNQTYNYIDRTGEIEIPSRERFNNTVNRQTFSGGNAVLGGGIEYKWNQYYFFFDAQYNAGLFLTNDYYNRYSNTVVGPYIDDDFRVNYLTFNVGFVKPLYKPRKKDKFTLRVLFKEISDQWINLRSKDNVEEEER